MSSSRALDGDREGVERLPPGNKSAAPVTSSVCPLVVGSSPDERSVSEQRRLGDNRNQNDNNNYDLRETPPLPPFKTIRFSFRVDWDHKEGGRETEREIKKRKREKAR